MAADAAADTPARGINVFVMQGTLKPAVRDAVHVVTRGRTLAKSVRNGDGSTTTLLVQGGHCLALTISCRPVAAVTATTDATLLLRGPPPPPPRPVTA
jgi:hypothetical protein